MPNYYNPYYPTQSNAYPTQSNAYPTQMNVGPTQPPQPQIQNGGFVSVRNETEARNYPIVIGTSVTFKDENAPYIYNKTMGFSQLEAPKFDKYRLVKEEVKETSNLAQGELFDVEPINASINDLKSEVERIWTEIEGVKKKVDSNSTQRTAQKKTSKIDPEEP